jgi:hypothetical protein
MNRRDFLTGTSLAAASMMAARSTPARRHVSRRSGR